MRRSCKVYILNKIFRVTEACSTYGENRSTERILCGKSEGSRQLRRSRARWENGIKINFKELMWTGGIDKGSSGEGQVVFCLNTITKFRHPKLRDIS